MASVLVCLFTTFFVIDKSLHLVCEEVEKEFSSKFPFAFTNTVWNNLKAEASPNMQLCFFGHLAFRLNISNMAASGTFFFFFKLSSCLHTDLFESISQSPSMFGTVPSALQGFMLQNSHVWIFVVINTWPVSRGGVSNPLNNPVACYRANFLLLVPDLIVVGHLSLRKN